MKQYYTIFERSLPTGGVETLCFSEAEIKRAAKRRVDRGTPVEQTTWTQWQLYQ